MQSGKLKRPITIQSPSTAQDAFGQQSQTSWTQLLDTWASIDVVTSREVYALGAGFTAQVSHKVTVRYQPDVVVAAGCRVLYCNRTFIVQAVSDPDEERRQLDLLCLEESK